MRLEPLISHTGILMTFYLSIILDLQNEFLPLIYPPEMEVKETTDTASSASCLDLYLEFDKDFNFKIINFPNMCSYIPASPAYGVYISQFDSLCKGQ